MSTDGPEKIWVMQRAHWLLFDHSAMHTCSARQTCTTSLVFLRSSCTANTSVQIADLLIQFSHCVPFNKCSKQFKGSGVPRVLSQMRSVCVRTSTQAVETVGSRIRKRLRISWLRKCRCTLAHGEQPKHETDTAYPWQLTLAGERHCKWLLIMQTHCGAIKLFQTNKERSRGLDATR